MQMIRFKEKARILNFIWYASLWLFVPNVIAAPVIEVNEEHLRLELTPYVDVFEDIQGTLTFDEIRSEKFSNQFSPSPLTALYFGYTRSAYWLRFSVENQLDHDQAFIFEVTPADIERFLALRGQLDETAIVRQAREWAAQQAGKGPTP